MMNNGRITDYQDLAREKKTMLHSVGKTITDITPLTSFSIHFVCCAFTVRKIVLSMVSITKPISSFISVENFSL